MKHRKGFTLIELIVVLVIFASIGGIIVGVVKDIASDDYVPEEAQEQYEAPPQDSVEVEQLKIQNELLKKIVDQKSAEKQ